MPDIQDIIEFLERHDALQLGKPPLPHPVLEDDIYEVDWQRLLKPPSDDEPVGDPRLMTDIRENLGRKPEPRDKDAPTIELPATAHQAHHFCAWYAPIHFNGPDFGIFIRQECILRKWVPWIARFLRSSTPVTPKLSNQLIRAATFQLFLHEHYHHKIESLGLRLHVATGKSCYCAVPLKCPRFED